MKILKILCSRCHGKDLAPAVCQDCNGGGVWWRVLPGGTP